MESGKLLSTCQMNIMPKDLVLVMRSTLRLRDWSSACILEHHAVIWILTILPTMDPHQHLLWHLERRNKN